MDFLFRRESVDTEGHVSKAPRITRPGNLAYSFNTCFGKINSSVFLAPRESTKLHVVTCPDFVALPHRVIEYQFIDESASIMSPTLARHRSPSPHNTDASRSSYSSTSSSSGSPKSAFSLLLEAATTKPMTMPDTHQVPTPPQSPGELALNYGEISKILSSLRIGKLI